MLDMKRPIGAGRTLGNETFERPTAAGVPSVGIDDVFRFVKRRKYLIGSLAILGFLVGNIYLVFAVPVYTAGMRLLIDTRYQDNPTQQGEGAYILDTAAIESQLELMRSRAILIRVVEALKLQDVPEFNGTAQTAWAEFTGRIWTRLGYPPAPPVVWSEEQRKRIATAILGGGVGASRVGRSYIIEITFSSSSRDWVAPIANALGNAYIADQLDARYSSAQRATVWLQERIAELRDQANVSEREVLRYRSENNIIDTGQGGTFASQQLNDSAQQMMKARAEVAEAKVRLDRLTDIMNSARSGRMPDATVTEINSNPIIQRLRSTFVDVQKREGDISARFGRDHVQAVTLRNEMRGLQDSMVNELRRVVETVRSEYEIAMARDGAVRSAFNEFVKLSNSAGEAKIPLRELEAAAQSFRGLYDTFLAQQAQANQRITFPRTEARVIAPASTPWVPTSPNANRITVMSLLAGLALGVGAAFARENLDRVFRTPQQVERLLGVECLGILPRVSNDLGLMWRTNSSTRERKLMRYVIDHPLSRFSETLRSVKVTLDLSGLARESHVVGFVSGMPNEGKTTVASNFATLTAGSGRATVLIDMDLRNPSLSRRLAPDAKVGLLEVLQGEASLDEALILDPATKLRFLPVIVQAPNVNTSEILGSSRMAALVDDLRRQVAYVVLDLPPLAPVVDARATVNLVDAYLLVVMWGQSRHDVLREALKGAPEVQDKFLGAILNNTNMKSLQGHDSHSASYYNSRYYKRYGYEG